MQAHAPRRGQFVVERLAYQRVRKAVAAHGLGHFDDNARAERLLYDVKEPIIIEIAELLERVKGELAADHGRYRQYGVAFFGKPVEPPADDFADAFRDRHTPGRDFIGALQPPVADEQPDDFMDEERVAFRLLVDDRNEPRRWLKPRRHGDEAMHILFRQSA